VLYKTRLFEQEGKFLYEYVSKNVPDAVCNLLKKAKLTLEDITWFVPHSANLRMIEALSKRLNIPIKKTLISNKLYGNTSSASIPLAIWIALEESKIKSGDKMILYGFGAGLTHGGVVIEW
jgi:3-oxoacyl-[acyl-carrier-protein] synthase III